MKNKFTGAACLFLLLLLAACSKERDIRTAIPSDVKMVVATDFKALVKKGGLTDPKMAQSVKKLIEENVPKRTVRLPVSCWMTLPVWGLISTNPFIPSGPRKTKWP